MVKAKGLYVALFVAGAAIVSACTAKSNGGSDSVSGTPTPSGTNTGVPTPTPFVTPDVNPVQSWVAPGGKELWVEVQASGNLTLQNIATYATTCSSGLLNVAKTMTNGQVEVFRFDVGKNASVMNCAIGAHTYEVDWKDGDGACDPCVTDNKKFTSTAANNFPAGPGILQNISAYVAYTSTAIRFTATNSVGPEVVVKGWRIYDPNTGLLQPDCAFGPVTIGKSSEPALFDTCKMDPTATVLVPGNSYDLYLYGTLNGVYYDEYGTMPFTNPP